MEHTFGLINNRLKNLKGMIEQHKYCIENNISVAIYSESLIKLEKEQSELAREYVELVQYCIKK